MKGLRPTFATMLATAAVVPLFVYGAISVYTLREGARQAVFDANVEVAHQVGEQIRRYVSTNLQVFQAVASEVEGAGLSRRRQELVFRNFVLRFPEFREITLFDPAGRQVSSSRAGRASWPPPPPGTPVILGVTMAPVVIDGDSMPTTIVALPISRDGRAAGQLVGQFSIEELWRMVSRVRVGARGAALVLGPGGQILAHGDPDELPAVAKGEHLDTHPVVAALRASGGQDAVVRDYTPPGRPRVLAAGVTIQELGWHVLVERPYQEAISVARRQENQLVATIAVALLVMVLIGSLWARRLIAPIDRLITGTRELAAGHLAERVSVSSAGEIGQLGTAFNTMADRLVELQEDVRRHERHAIFGRIAAGLVHDLSHPFKNVQNNCKLILKMHDDPEYRELFGRTVEREFATVRRVFDDLRNIARPMPLEHFPVDVNALARDVADGIRATAESAGIVFDVRLAPEAPHVMGDVFALARVCRNLLVNAIEASPGGAVTLAVEVQGVRCLVSVKDTGCGIPPERLAGLFEDFTTTKRSGLGLGLAIAHKIVEQLAGTITVTSVVGSGTTFVVSLPVVTTPAAEGNGADEGLTGDERTAG